MDKLRALTTFIRVARTGSFSKAARELAMTPQAVSHQVQQLERWVGVRLFNRTTRKISLTDEGLNFYGSCETAVEAIDEGVRSLHAATEEVVGKVRVAAPYGISWRFVAPSIGRFLEQHPRVSVELIVQNQVPDLVAQGIDVGILGDPLPENSMVVRRFGTVEHVLCATPDYLRRYGTPHSMEDLKGHRCINLRNWITGKLFPWQFQKSEGVVTEDVIANLTTNDGDSELQAVLSNAGIGQLSTYRIAPYVRTNHLVALQIGYLSQQYGLYVYMPRREQIPKKNRVLADFLFEELRTHPDLQPLMTG